MHRAHSCVRPQQHQSSTPPEQRAGPPALLPTCSFTGSLGVLWVPMPCWPSDDMTAGCWWVAIGAAERAGRGAAGREGEGARASQAQVREHGASLALYEKAIKRGRRTL